VGLTQDIGSETLQHHQSSVQIVIVIESVSQVVFEGPTYRGHDLDLSRSRDIIDHVTIRSVICHISIGGPLEPSLYLQSFRDIQPHKMLTNQQTRGIAMPVNIRKCSITKKNCRISTDIFLEIIRMPCAGPATPCHVGYISPVCDATCNVLNGSISGAKRNHSVVQKVRHELFTLRRSLHGFSYRNSVRLSVCRSHSWTVSTWFDLRS